MPRGDRTGPMGMGPMTGRAAGFCAGNAVPGYANPAPGRGFGMGRGGRGRGFRHEFFATGLPGWQRFCGYNVPYGYPTPYQNPDPEIEKQALMDQAKCLEAELGAIRQRLTVLEESKKA